MPKEKIMFISDFLIPHLDEKRFGERLQWIDEEEGKFHLHWNHKSAPDWTEFDIEVFMEWDKQKGHYNPNQKDYYSLSKQRFRALLYKLTTQQQLKRWKSTNKNLRIYSIINREHQKKKRKHISSVKKSQNNWVKLCDNDFKEGLHFTEREEMVTFSRVLEDHKYQCTGKTTEYMHQDQTLEYEVLQSPSSPSLYKTASTEVQKNLLNLDVSVVDNTSSKDLNSVPIENISPQVPLRKICLLLEEQKPDVVSEMNNTSSAIPPHILYYNYFPQKGKSQMNQEWNTYSEKKLLVQDPGNLSGVKSPEYSSNFQIVRLFDNEYFPIECTKTFNVGENALDMYNTGKRLENLETFTITENRSKSNTEVVFNGANAIPFSGDELSSTSDIICDVSLTSAASPLNFLLDEQMPPVLFAWPTIEIPS